MVLAWVSESLHPPFEVPGLPVLPRFSCSLRRPPAIGFMVEVSALSQASRCPVGA